MQKRRAIVKLSFLLFAIIIGYILAFVPFNLPGYKRYIGFANDIKLGIDLKGGMYAVYDTENEVNKDNLDERLASTALRLQEMVQGEGYSEATVVVEGSRLRIEVPDVQDSDALFRILGEPADMVFELYEGENGETQSTNYYTGITGKHLKDAYAASDGKGGYGVQLEFNSEGADLFYAVTRDNVGKFINIKVNDATKSNAKINEAIAGGKPIITGNFTYETADTLAKQILSGAFDVKLNLVESSIVSASLGEGVLLNSLIAGAVGIVLVMIFIGFIYKGIGVAVNIALLCFTILLLFILWSFPGIQLTLPSIAGIILSIGMAVDANVIINERIKEEYRAGKSVNTSITSGFKKSLWTVLDANITTVIAAIILIILGRSSVRGFGITLIIGIVVSIFSALVVTRFCLRCLQKITKDNSKFFGLKRDENVVEIADVVKVKENNVKVNTALDAQSEGGSV